MTGRRLVVMNFSEKTGNKIWSLLDINMFGNPVSEGLLRKTKKGQAIFTPRDIDFFTEFVDDHHMGGGRRFRSPVHLPA